MGGAGGGISFAEAGVDAKERGESGSGHRSTSAAHRGHGADSPAKEDGARMVARQRGQTNSARFTGSPSVAM
jgi:hypothetical protein